MLPAESKFLSLQGTDITYHEKQQSMRKQPFFLEKYNYIDSNVTSYLKVNSEGRLTPYESKRSRGFSWN
ncbi:hypothetical protein HMPREF3291_09560 [Bacillus sp. HMSC76G11]|nr:hypothetical protein HMPREF3291_09560 [Bacillus sp. HMSC76G11]